MVRQYWREIDKGMDEYELPILQVADFLVRKRIATDRESAKRIIKGVKSTQEGPKKDLINYDEFKRIFCKSIFRYALILTAQKLKESSHLPDEILPLAVKVSRYQRGLLRSGLQKENPNYEEGKSILAGLSVLTGEPKE